MRCHLEDRGGNPLGTAHTAHTYNTILGNWGMRGKTLPYFRISGSCIHYSYKSHVAIIGHFIAL